MVSLRPIAGPPRLMRALMACLILCALGLSACQPDPGRRQTTRNAGLKGGQLVFEDSFNRDSLGDRWTANPKAKLADGWLQIEENYNEPPLWLDLKLPDQVRIEFDARTRSSEGDIKVEVFGDGQKHSTGYILVYGAHNNKEDWFARLDEHGKDRLVRESRGAVKDQTYRMALVRLDQQVKWFIDGELFYHYDDPKPLKGAGHEHFAFNTWKARLEFDNVRVFDLSQR